MPIYLHLLYLLAEFWGILIPLLGSFPILGKEIYDQPTRNL